MTQGNQPQAAPEQPALMQRTEKQKNDVSALLSLARGTGLLREDPEPGPGAPAAGLGDDETDPAAEEVLGGGPGEPARPGASPGRPDLAPKTGVPDWFVMPDGMLETIEPGVQVAYVRMLSHLTGRPTLGDRQCMLVPLGVKEEGFAYKRVQAGSASAAVSELARWMIRVIDGKVPNWRKPHPLDKFWDEIGPRYRRMIESWYVKTHVLAGDARADFLANCLDDRLAG